MVTNLHRTKRFYGDMDEDLVLPGPSKDPPEPVDTTDTVAEYLKSWGLEEYIQKFREQQIDIDVLKILSPEDIAELVPIIGHRTKLRSQIAMLKTIVSNNVYSDIQTVANDLQYYAVTYDLTPAQATPEPKELKTATYDLTPAQATPEPKELKTATKLYETLSSCNEGKGLLLRFQETGLLDNAARRRLCQLIINNELKNDPEKKLSSSWFYQTAYEIAQIYVKENPAIYFTPFMSFGTHEKSSAKGKLLDCYRQKRRDFLKHGLIKGKEKICDSAEPQLDVEEGDLEDQLLWLKESCDPWEKVEKNWDETTKKRMNMLQSENLTIKEYYAAFKALNQQKGLCLILKDYKVLYPENDQALQENWTLIRAKIIEHSKKCSTSFIKEIMKNIEHEKNEEIVDMVAFMVIPFLMPTLTVKKKDKGKVWRPSKQETLEGFVCHVTSAAEIQTTLKRRVEKLAGIGLTMQPLIVVVGPTIKEICSRYIVVNDVHYEVTTITHAVEACFKIMFVLNAKYPAECVHVWQFLQTGVFKLKNKHDKIYTSVKTLMTDLNIESE